MTHEDAMFHERVTEFVQWGSRLSPEERAWQVNCLLPAVLGALRDAADEAAAEEAAKQAAE